jgi:flagellar biosynthesis GTPase FlhF
MVGIQLMNGRMNEAFRSAFAEWISPFTLTHTPTGCVCGEERRREEKRREEKRREEKKREEKRRKEKKREEKRREEKRREEKRRKEKRRKEKKREEKRREEKRRECIHTHTHPVGVCVNKCTHTLPRGVWRILSFHSHTNSV